MKVRISQSRDRAGEAGFNYSRRQTHRAKEDCEMSVAVITGTSLLGSEREAGHSATGA
jgi:hypothetical protein